MNKVTGIANIEALASNRLSEPSTPIAKNDSMSSPRSYKAGLRRLRTETDPHQIKLLAQCKANIKPNDVEIAKILLAYGGDPRTVVFRAAEKGDLDSVRKLIEYGVSIEDLENKKNVLDYSLNSRNTDLMKYLIDEQGLKCSDIFSPFYSFILNPPFFPGIDLFLSKGYVFPDYIIASLFYHNGRETKLEDLKGLVLRGANTNCLKEPEVASQILNFGFAYNNCYCPNQQGSPYQLFSLNKELLNLLLSYGINVNVEIGKIKDSRKITNQQNNSKAFSTLLLIAIAYNDEELLKNLIQNGADVNLSGKQWGVYNHAPVCFFERLIELPPITPLKLAIELKNQELTTFLLENGAKF